MKADGDGAAQRTLAEKAIQRPSALAPGAPTRGMPTTSWMLSGCGPAGGPGGTVKTRPRGAVVSHIAGLWWRSKMATSASRLRRAIFTDPAAMTTRDELVFHAKIAEQLERYGELVRDWRPMRSRDRAAQSSCARKWHRICLDLSANIFSVIIFVIRAPFTG